SIARNAEACLPGIAHRHTSRVLSPSQRFPRAVWVRCPVHIARVRLEGPIALPVMRVQSYRLPVGTQFLSRPQFPLAPRVGLFAVGGPSIQESAGLWPARFSSSRPHVPHVCLLPLVTLESTAVLVAGWPFRQPEHGLKQRRQRISGC